MSLGIDTRPAISFSGVDKYAYGVVGVLWSQQGQLVTVSLPQEDARKQEKVWGTEDPLVPLKRSLLNCVSGKLEEADPRGGLTREIHEELGICVEPERLLAIALCESVRILQVRPEGRVVIGAIPYSLTLTDDEMRAIRLKAQEEGREVVVKPVHEILAQHELRPVLCCVLHALLQEGRYAPRYIH